MNACLACRQVKMKCCLREGESKCDRCTRRTLECIFREHRRGRKVGTRISKHSRIQSGAPDTIAQQHPPRERASDRRAPSTAADIEDTTADINDPRSESASLQPSGLFNSDATTGGRFSLLNILGHSAIEKRVDAVQEASAAATQDPIRNGLINESIAEYLFESFVNILNPYISQLDPTLHTFEYTRQKSSFLLSAVLAASSKIFNPSLYKALLKHAEDLFMENFHRGTRSTETAQAIMILTYWKEPDDTRTWVNLGYVIRMGMDLGWHRLGLRSVQSALASGLSEYEVRRMRDEERTWFVLFVYDRSLSLQTGKPWMIERNKFIEAIEPWCKDSLATENDVLLGAFVTLRLLTSEVFRLLGSSLQRDSSPNMSSFLTMISNRIDEWEDKWLPMCANESESCHYFLVRFYGTHLRLQLYALPLQEALQSNEHDITHHLEALWASLSSAVSMLKLVSQFSSRLYFVQDSVHVMTAYSAAFLIKVLLSVPMNIARDFEPTIIEAIRNAAAALSQQAAPPGSSCSMQHIFLRKVLSNYDEIITKRNMHVERESNCTNRMDASTSTRNDMEIPYLLGSRNSIDNAGVSAAASSTSTHHDGKPLTISDSAKIPLQFTGLATANTAGFSGSAERMDAFIMSENDAWTDVFTTAGFTVQDGFPFA